MTKFCCQDIERDINYKCDNEFDCFDRMICYNNKMDEYGIIIHDGGSSYVEINFCPFCGAKLPYSKRDIYFDLLEKLGFEDDKGNILKELPEEFKTDEWWKKRGL